MREGGSSSFHCEGVGVDDKQDEFERELDNFLRAVSDSVFTYEFRYPEELQREPPPPEEEPTLLGEVLRWLGLK